MSGSTSSVFLFSFLLSPRSSLSLIFIAHFLLPLLCSISSEAAHCEENDLCKTSHSKFDQSWHSDIKCHFLSVFQRFLDGTFELHKNDWEVVIHLPGVEKSRSGKLLIRMSAELLLWKQDCIILDAKRFWKAQKVASSICFPAAFIFCLWIIVLWPCSTLKSSCPHLSFYSLSIILLSLVFLTLSNGFFMIWWIGCFQVIICNICI